MDIRISVIIGARNNAEYIEEAINSVLNQTVKVHEIIYSDDFSTDNSVEIVSKIKEHSEIPITTLRHAKHNGVVYVRNDGYKHSEGNVLIFLDGDDKLKEDYIERSLEVFDESTPFVYNAAQSFGFCNYFFHVPPWDSRCIWDRNYCNTSMLMWAEVFDKAGKWKDTKYNTMWDWDLAIRMSQFGKPKRGTGLLYYRKHKDSHSTKLREGFAKDFEYYKDAAKDIRHNNVRMTIGLVYSGRIPELLPMWMDALVKDIEVLKYLPELIIINNSKKEFPADILEKYDNKFIKIKTIRDDYKIEYRTESERRNKVSTFLSYCYSTILENASGNVIHLREDDIIPVDGAFSSLYDFILGKERINTVVSGTYKNRNKGRENYYVGGWINKNNFKKTHSTTKLPDADKVRVDFCGTGMLLFWKEYTPKYFPPNIHGMPAHDWAWAIKHRNEGGSIYMLPKAECKHYTDKENYLMPLDNKKTTKEYKPIYRVGSFDNITMTIGLVYSGRLSVLAKEWMEQLIKDIKILKYKPELIIINNSKKELPKEFFKHNDKLTVREIRDDYKITFNTERKRRIRLIDFLAKCYTTILQEAKGEVVHLREDDIIPVDGSFKMLHDFIFSSNIVNKVVTGLYQNRHIKEKNKTETQLMYDDKPIEINYCGTGMLMFWKNYVPQEFPKTTEKNASSHDWGWSIKHGENNGALYVLPQAICKHYIDDNNFLLPLDQIRPAKHYIRIKG